MADNRFYSQEKTNRMPIRVVQRATIDSAPLISELNVSKKGLLTIFIASCFDIEKNALLRSSIER